MESLLPLHLPTDDHVVAVYVRPKLQKVPGIVLAVGVGKECPWGLDRPQSVSPRFAVAFSGDVVEQADLTSGREHSENPVHSIRAPILADQEIRAGWQDDLLTEFFNHLLD